MSITQEVTDLTFKEEIIDSSIPVLVDFWAPWCGPCRKLAPVLDELAQELEGKAKIVKINVDQNQEKASEYGISGIPSLLVFKNGKMVDNTSGLQPKSQLESMIRKYL